MALVGLMSLCLSTWGAAQERRLEVTGFLGGLSVTQDLGTSSNIYLEATGEGQNVDFGKYLGIRVAFMITRIIGIEGGYSQGTNSYTYSVDDNEVGNVDLGEQFDVKQSNFSGNVLIQYPSTTDSSLMEPSVSVDILRIQKNPSRVSKSP